MGGDFSQGTVDSAAIFLFELFSAEPMMTRSHAEEIKRMFGPYPASTVSRVCKTVERILTYLPDGWGKPIEKMETAKSAKKRKEFGHNIQFKFTDGFLDPATSKPADFPGYDSLSDSEEDVPVKSKIANFVASSLQTNSAAASATIGGGEGDGSMVAIDVSHAPRSSELGGPYSSDWMMEQCKECLGEGQFAGELTCTELYQAIFEQLSSERDNTVIQNDVRTSLLYLFV